MDIDMESHSNAEIDESIEEVLESCGELNESYADVDKSNEEVQECVSEKSKCNSELNEHSEVIDANKETDRLVSSTYDPGEHMDTSSEGVDDQPTTFDKKCVTFSQEDSTFNKKSSTFNKDGTLINKEQSTFNIHPPSENKSLFKKECTFEKESLIETKDSLEIERSFCEPPYINVPSFNKEPSPFDEEPSFAHEPSTFTHISPIAHGSSLEDCTFLLETSKCIQVPSLSNELIDISKQGLVSTQESSTFSKESPTLTTNKGPTGYIKNSKTCTKLHFSVDEEKEMFENVNMNTADAMESQSSSENSTIEASKDASFKKEISKVSENPINDSTFDENKKISENKYLGEKILIENKISSENKNFSDTKSLSDKKLAETKQTSDSPSVSENTKLTENVTNSEQSTTTKQNRELKLLLELSKEANLDTNIAYKRKSIDPNKFTDKSESGSLGKICSTTPTLGENRETFKRSMRSQNPEFVAKHQKFLMKVSGTDPDAIHITSESKEHREEKHSKKHPSLDSSVDGNSDDANKKIRKPLKMNTTMIKKGKDAFCWRCHRDSIQISCETCVRSYHMRCLKSGVTNPDHWPCPECVAILRAESTKTRSPALKELTLEQLCGLLKFAHKRMVQCTDSEPFMHPVNEKEFPEYKTYIIYPMDLMKLDLNIKANLYGSTTAFEADAKWLLHNSIIFNSFQAKLTSIARSIIKVCKQEMSEIDNCSACYLNANTKKDWFVEVCPKPHRLVWAKLKGFPFWPAKAMNTNSSGMVDVRFFGAHDRAWVPVRECYLFSRKDPNSNNQKKHEINECIKEVEIYIENLKKIHGGFRYAPYRTLFDPNLEIQQLQIFLPNYKANIKLTPVKYEPGKNDEKGEEKPKAAELLLESKFKKSISRGGTPIDGSMKEIISKECILNEDISKESPLNEGIPKESTSKESISKESISGERNSKENNTSKFKNSKESRKKSKLMGELNSSQPISTENSRDSNSPLIFTSHPNYLINNSNNYLSEVSTPPKSASEEVSKLNISKRTFNIRPKLKTPILKNNYTEGYGTDDESMISEENESDIEDEHSFTLKSDNCEEHKTPFENSQGDFPKQSQEGLSNEKNKIVLGETNSSDELNSNERSFKGKDLNKGNSIGRSSNKRNSHERSSYTKAYNERISSDRKSRIPGSLSNSQDKFTPTVMASIEGGVQKRSSTDDPFESTKKVSRRNSDQSLLADSTRLSDKISKVDIAEDMEITLGNDETGNVAIVESISPESSTIHSGEISFKRPELSFTQIQKDSVHSGSAPLISTHPSSTPPSLTRPISTLTSSSQSELLSELKKKPVQVNIENKEFMISPQSKCSIADRLMKRLSGEDCPDKTASNPLKLETIKKQIFDKLNLKENECSIVKYGKDKVEKKKGARKIEEEGGYEDKKHGNKRQEEEKFEDVRPEKRKHESARSKQEKLEGETHEKGRHMRCNHVERRRSEEIQKGKSMSIDLVSSSSSSISMVSMDAIRNITMNRDQLQDIIFGKPSKVKEPITIFKPSESCKDEEATPSCSQNIEDLQMDVDSVLGDNKQIELVRETYSNRELSEKSINENKGVNENKVNESKETSVKNDGNENKGRIKNEGRSEGIGGNENKGINEIKATIIKEVDNNQGMYENTIPLSTRTKSKIPSIADMFKIKHVTTVKETCEDSISKTEEDDKTKYINSQEIGSQRNQIQRIENEDSSMSKETSTATKTKARRKETSNRSFYECDFESKQLINNDSLLGNSKLPISQSSYNEGYNLLNIDDKINEPNTSSPKTSTLQASSSLGSDAPNSSNILCKEDTSKKRKLSSESEESLEKPIPKKLIKVVDISTITAKGRTTLQETESLLEKKLNQAREQEKKEREQELRETHDRERQNKVRQQRERQRQEKEKQGREVTEREQQEVEIHKREFSKRQRLLREKQEKIRQQRENRQMEMKRKQMHQKEKTRAKEITDFLLREKQQNEKLEREKLLREKQHKEIQLREVELKEKLDKEMKIKEKQQGEKQIGLPLQRYILNRENLGRENVGKGQQIPPTPKDFKQRETEKDIQQQQNLTLQTVDQSVMGSMKTYSNSGRTSKKFSTTNSEMTNENCQLSKAAGYSSESQMEMDIKTEVISDEDDDAYQTAKKTYMSALTLCKAGTDSEKKKQLEIQTRSKTEERIKIQTERRGSFETMTGPLSSEKSGLSSDKSTPYSDKVGVYSDKTLNQKDSTVSKSFKNVDNITKIIDNVAAHYSEDHEGEKITLKKSDPKRERETFKILNFHNLPKPKLQKSLPKPTPLVYKKVLPHRPEEMRQMSSKSFTGTIRAILSPSGTCGMNASASSANQATSVIGGSNLSGMSNAIGASSVTGSSSPVGSSSEIGASSDLRESNQVGNLRDIETSSLLGISGGTASIIKASNANKSGTNTSRTLTGGTASNATASSVTASSTTVSSATASGATGPSATTSNPISFSSTTGNATTPATNAITLESSSSTTGHPSGGASTLNARQTSLMVLAPSNLMNTITFLPPNQTIYQNTNSTNPTLTMVQPLSIGNVPIGAGINNRSKVDNLLESQNYIPQSGSSTSVVNAISNSRTANPSSYINIGYPSSIWATLLNGPPGLTATNVDGSSMGASAGLPMGSSVGGHVGASLGHVVSSEAPMGTTAGGPTGSSSTEVSVEVSSTGASLGVSSNEGTAINGGVSGSNRGPEQSSSCNLSDSLNRLSDIIPDSISRAITDVLCRPPPTLKPRPPGPLSTHFDEGYPSSLGPVTTRINSISHRLTDYFRGMLIETLQDIGGDETPEATITNLKLELEEVNHRHGEEILEIKKNINSILKDIQKSVLEERQRVIDETRAACEAEAIKRVSEAKSKQWCANCLKEAFFFCCWNTSYCDFSCQKVHWAKHATECQNTSTNAHQSTATKTSGQPILLRQANTFKQVSQKTVLGKPTKFLYNRTSGGTVNYVKNASGNHLTIVEATPGKYELVGNGPISVGGKIINNTKILQKIKPGNIITVSSPSHTCSTNTQQTFVITQTRPATITKPASVTKPATQTSETAMDVLSD